MDAPAAPDKTTGIAALEHEAILLLTGQDSRSFLQGQTSADFQSAKPDDVLGGAFCDLKGRVIADFLAVVLDEASIALRLDASLVPVLTEHTAKYLMFAKAALAPSDWAVHGLLDVEYQRAIGLSEQVPVVRLPEVGAAIYRALGETELWLPRGAVSPAMQPISAAQWQAHAVDRGEARILARTTGKYLPQDLNYDLQGWVSFDKGCYMGQEIIARLHWRGTPKRRLYGLFAAPGSAPEPGMALLSNASGRVAGSVVNSAPLAAGTWLSVEATEAGMTEGLVLEGSDAVLEPLPTTH